MKLVDTHTHLYLEEFNTDRDEVIKTALDAGVTAMLLPNIDSSTIKAMEALSGQFPENCFAMMGLHPTSVKENYESELATVEQKLSSTQYIAVGEIGIDLYWDKTYHDQQLDAFRSQLKMAKKYKLPVSIHTRDSFHEVYPIVKEELTDDLKGVFHCFLGTDEEAKKIMNLGFLMGVGGVITFKNSNIGDVIKTIPNKYLVFETDAPYLTPAPFRGKRNQSAYIPYILEKTASLKNISPETLAAITTENAVNLFQIKMNYNG
ncbi:MAG: hydrolase TatD [Bacteroidetes bacterium]|nr:MAG: hydrolase TatD [Bacteroidota bacterium]